MCGAIPSLFCMSSWHGTLLNTGTTLPLPFTLLIYSMYIYLVIYLYLYVFFPSAADIYWKVYHAFECYWWEQQRTEEYLG